MPQAAARSTTWLSILVYLAFCGLVIVNGLTRPIANWDMLAYTAAVVERQGQINPQQIHAEAYGLVRAAVTDAQWHELTQASRYRVVQARDANAFVSMLPMYQVKGGYIALVDVASRFAGPVAAMRMISLLAVLGLMGMLFWTFRQLGALRLIGLLTPVMGILSFPDLASMSAPDPLVVFLATSAACLILANLRPRPPVLALGLLLAAVPLRPDMLVATTGLPLALVAGCALAAMLNRRGWRESLSHGLLQVGPWPWAALVAGIGAYMLAKAGTSHPGWFAHFMFSLHEQRDTMAGFQPAFDLKIYVLALIRAIMRLLREESWPWLMFSLMLAGLFFARLRDFGPVLLGILIFIIGNWAVRTLVFPLPDSRVAAPIVLSAIMVAVAMIGRKGQACADDKLATDGS